MNTKQTEEKKLERNLHTNLSWGHHKAFILKVLKNQLLAGWDPRRIHCSKETNNSVLPRNTPTFMQQRIALGPNTILPKDISSLQVVFLVGETQRVVEITGVQIN